VKPLGNPVVAVSISQTSLSCKPNDLYWNFPTQYNSIIANLDTSTWDIAGAFNFNLGSTGTLISSSSVYKNCYIADSGAIFTIPSGLTFTDTSSIFQQNAAVSS
jgi:hypothetical protein